MASRARRPIANAGGPYTATVNVGLRVDGSLSTSTSGAPLVSYYWAWGDGTSSVSSQPQSTHIYAVRGSYRLRLTVTDALGSTSKPASTNVSVVEGNVAPTVTIISPIMGDTFIAPADILISATASDVNGTVVSVKFYADSTLLTTLTSPPYDYNWTSVPVGAYVITAVAEDNVGATTSTSVNITVGTTPTPPTVEITYPADNASFSAPASFTITADAADADEVTSVAFYLDDVLLSTDTTSPYSADVSALAGGTHTIYAIATNSNSLTTTSDTITITVTPAAPVVTITSPTNGQVFTAPADITVAANASSAGGTITQVEFFKNAVSIGVDTSAPYSVDLTSQPAGTYTFTATATNNSAATGDSAPVVVTVNPTPPTPTVDLTSSASTITLGQSITLSWTSTDATTATASGSWSGSKSLNGSEVITPPAAGSYTYTLSVTGAGGTVEDSVTVTVNNPSAPTVSISGNPLSIQIGQSTTLTWTSSGGVTATASGAWSGAKALNGSQVVTPQATGSIVYTITVTNPGGSTSASVTITVTPVPPAPPTVDLQTSAIAISLGQSITLTWTSTGATSATASGSWSGSKALNGSEVITPPAVGTYTYTLSVIGAGGSANDSVTVVVSSGGGGGVIATYGFTAGPTTFGLALAQGTTPTAVQIGSLTTQTDVKTRWSDGTIRFAIVSAVIPTAGTYNITAGPVSGAPFTPTWPTIALNLVINGITWTASPGSFPGTSTWLSGSIVREERVNVSPMNGPTPHPLLEVYFDIRSYAAGGHRIDFTVQNVLDTTSMDKVACSSVALVINGSTVWTHGPVTSYSFTRWRKVYASGFTEAEITPDFTPAYAAGVLPKILSTVSNKTYDLTAPQYDIMGGISTYPKFSYGEMNPDMGAGGGREEIGGLCWWEARYLVHKTQNLRQTVLRNADLTGCWSNHLLSGAGAFIKLGDTGYNPAQWWWDSRASSGNRPLAPLSAATNFRGAREGLSTDTDTGSVGVASQYNAQHVPAPMFLAYLLTGDRFYMNQAKFWATSAILHKTPSWVTTDTINFPGWRRGRNGATGNERILDDDGMTREFAWPLRLVATTTWMLPPTDGLYSYLMTTMQNNLNHAADYYDYWVSHNYGGAIGSIGGAEVNSGWSLYRSGQETGRYTSTWRLAYTAYSMDWCTRQSLWTITASMQGFINRIIRFHILMNTQNPQFLSGKAGLSYPYYPAINTITGGVITKWLDNFPEIKSYNETYLYQDPPCVGNCATWDPNQPQTGYYDVEHHMTLQIGIRRGLTDAQTAETRLLQVPGVQNDINNRPGFAITF